ncbi:MAG: GNAT family N-acetyltransferase [Eubacteriales bacterium]|nr:GNAT family N-acetyltransferase [Eubacteriales bacterium]
MFDIKHDDYIFASPEFLKDRLLFDVMWYAREGAEILKSDCKSFVICRTNENFPAVVWTDDDISQKDFDCLAFCLKQTFRGKVPYFMVKENQAERVKGVFNPLKQESCTGLVAYVMDKPTSIKVSGTLRAAETFRVAEVRDTDTLVGFIRGFQTDCFGNPASDEEIRLLAEKRVSSPDSYVFEADGKTVGMLYCGRKSEGYCRIGMVYIAPEYRSKGYGLSMVKQGCERIIAEGFIPNLFADAANPVSNHVYLKTGFREVGRIAEIKMNGVQ